MNPNTAKASIIRIIYLSVFFILLMVTGILAFIFIRGQSPEKALSLLKQLQEISPPSQTQKQPMEGTILMIHTALRQNYRSEGDCESIIYSLDPESKSTTDIVKFPSCDVRTVISPQKDVAAFAMREYEFKDGKQVGRENYKEYIKIINLKTKAEIATIPDIWLSTAPIWSRDGEYLAYVRAVEGYTPMAREHQIFVFDLKKKSGQQIGSLLGAFSDLIGFSEDKKGIYARTLTGPIQLLDVISNANATVYPVPANVAVWTTMSPDQKTIAVVTNKVGTNGGNPTWTISSYTINTKTIKELYTSTNTSLFPFGVLFRTNTSFMYALTSDTVNGELWTIDITNGQREKYNVYGLTSPFPMEISRDGSLLLVRNFYLDNSMASNDYYLYSLQKNLLQQLSTKPTTSPLGDDAIGLLK